jgi:hypothetical protein
MRTILRTTIVAAAIAGLNLAGSSVQAEQPGPDQSEHVAAVDLIGDESPSFGPDEETDDQCDPVEGPCGGDDDDDPVDPAVPDGPDEVTDDLCDPVEADCGDDDGEDPLPEPCVLDEVCTRTPTFTG